MKVLIADDDQSSREAPGALASCYGHEVFVCADGIETIAAVSWFSPDLILTWRCPGWMVSPRLGA